VIPLGDLARRKHRPWLVGHVAQGDDRCELYRDHGLSRYIELRDHPERIEGLTGNKAPHLALVRSRSPLRRYLEDSPNWSTLHQDPTASLFLRKPH